MDFLEKLDYLMGREHLNKHTLSQLSGIPYTTIVSFYKKGYENTKMSTAKKLASCLNVSLDYLVDDSISDENYGRNQAIEKSPAPAEASTGDQFNLGEYEMWLDTFNDMRRKSGMSLDELSEKSGVPKGTLAKITSGITKSPALETMKSLVYAMGFTLDDLDPETKKSTPAPAEASTGDQFHPEDIYNILLKLGLIKSGQDLTDADLRFILSVGQAVRVWFDDRK